MEQCRRRGEVPPVSQGGLHKRSGKAGFLEYEGEEEPTASGGVGWRDILGEGGCNFSEKDQRGSALERPGERPLLSCA